MSGEYRNDQEHHSELIDASSVETFIVERWSSEFGQRKSAQLSAMRASSKVTCKPSDYQVAETAGSTEFAAEYSSSKNCDDGGATITSLESQHVGQLTMERLRLLPPREVGRYGIHIKPYCEQREQQYGNSCMTFLFTCSPEKDGDLILYFTAAHYLASFASETLDIPDRSSVVDVILNICSVYSRLSFPTCEE